MASRYEVEVTVTSAKDLKNVNWRHGRLKPYAVLWVESRNKCTTRVDEEGDQFPYWDQKLVIPFNSPIDETTLYIDVVHAAQGSSEDLKPLVGSARLNLRDVDSGERTTRKLELKRPSGRPHGQIDVKVAVRETRYRAPDPYASGYGVPPPTSRDVYSAPPPPAYGGGYGAPYQSAPPAGYPPYGQPAGYGQPQPSYAQAPPSYGQPAYGQPAPPQQPAYGQDSSYGQQPVQEKKKGTFGGMGMGTGLAVGAVGGLLGGLAIKEGYDYFEDKIADDAAERVEDDRDDYRDDDRGYDDDY